MEIMHTAEYRKVSTQFISHFFLSPNKTHCDLKHKWPDCITLFPFSVEGFGRLPLISFFPGTASGCTASSNCQASDLEHRRASKKSRSIMKAVTISQSELENVWEGRGAERTVWSYCHTAFIILTKHIWEKKNGAFETGVKTWLCGLDWGWRKMGSTSASPCLLTIVNIKF